MAENKTRPTRSGVSTFIAAVENDRRQQDSKVLLEMMSRITGFKPQMWGDAIVGYGRYRYKYESGRSGEYFLTGFSPRKSAMTIYIMPGFMQYEKQLAKLGRHRHSVSCLYVARLDAIALDVLEDIIADSVERMKSIYPDWAPR
ncbi:MAG: DUF1801 domain-containing protein [Alphaproteobacteria bacterium]|nr:DUF1801 domain-containing protein [Alphaproteobacteria bacterium]